MPRPGRLLSCALLLAGTLCFAGACGSGDKSNGDSANGSKTNTGTSTSSSVSGTFAGSCLSVADIGETAPYTQCTDFYGTTADGVQQRCARGTNDTQTSTYSADHCPTENLLGKCTRSSYGTVDYYYLGSQSITKETVCTSFGDTWSEP